MVQFLGSTIIADFDRAIKADPNYATAYEYRGIAWDRKREYDRAVADFSQVIILKPTAEGYRNRGNVWIEKKEYDRAIADYDQAIKLDPKLAVAYCCRGIAWGEKHEYDRAIIDYDKAITLDPAFVFAYSNRGVVWYEKQQYARAVADFNQAIKSDPNDAISYNNLAYFQTTCPDARFRDGKKAVQNAKQACQLSGEKNAICIGTLAAAYAESGDFEKAKDYQTKAIELLTDESDREEYRSSLRLYEQGKPCHPEPHSRLWW